MTILVVDDESESLSLLTTILTAEGYNVRPADKGELALASILVERPQLILLDVRMPGMGGFEVCQRLKGDPNTRDIPIMFLSASGELREQVQGLTLGAVDFVTKPFQSEALLARVRTHLELSILRARLEEKVAERTAELRETEGRFQAMADAAPVMIWASGTDKLCTFFNRGWLEFTGRSLEAELGNGWTTGAHRDDLERSYASYVSSFDAHKSFQLEYRLRRADGEYRWVFDTGVPRFAPGGVFAGYIGSCIDITELKQNQERMLAAQKLESLGVMAAGIAHDFGNLLGSIFAEADLALSEIPPKTPGRDSVERIETVATYATDLVKNLMASAGAGTDSSAIESIDLSSLVEQTLRLQTISISKVAVVRCGFAKDLPAILGNVAELRQVVMNLIRNASEALSGEQGFITITTERARFGPSSASNDLTNMPDGEYVRLKVSDTGCGMSAQTRAKIFDQFFTTKPEGRGLGLSTVHGIVRSHGGAINVESTPGAGTTFEVLFPCADQREKLRRLARSGS